jgi:hypothetical protein
MTQPFPTLRESYGRWTFTYYVEAAVRPGMGFTAAAEVHEGTVLKRRFVLSWPAHQDEMTATLRGYCEEYVKDLEDPSRVEKRNERYIGDRIKTGQAGEKGLI